LKNSELKHQIVSSYMPFDPDRIVLFGSYAKDDEDKFSDIDLIIVYSTSKSFLDRLKELYLCWNIPKAVDILAYTPEEYQKMMLDNSFLQDAVNEGEVLYERDS
jgi:predicted nucleotidyltransferase